MAKKNRDETPRYVPMTNLERSTLLEGLNSVRPEDLRGAKTQKLFMRATAVLEYPEDEQLEIDNLNRRIEIANRGIALARDVDDVREWSEKQENLREELTEWNKHEEIHELSLTTLEALIDFGEKAPLTGLGRRRVHSLIERLREAKTADEDSDFFKRPRSNGETEEVAAESDR